MNFITFDDLSNCIYKNISRIPKDVDLIVGIPRSGTLCANLLALYINKPFIDINGLLRKERLASGSTRKCADWIKSCDEAKHILVVDDSISSGKAMKEAKEKISQAEIQCKVTYLAVYALRVTCKMVDIYFEICEQPRMFEWNYMHHWALEYTLMDIDGVLCNDPKISEKLSEKKYREFILNAAPKIIPTQKIGGLVSGRLETYREETEQWLKDNRVQWGELSMLPIEEEGCSHATFKARLYENSDAVLFIESSYEQAIEICRISHKPVFCVENKKMITTDNLIDHIKCIKADWHITAKRVVKKLLGRIDYIE